MALSWPAQVNWARMHLKKVFLPTGQTWQWHCRAGKPTWRQNLAFGSQMNQRAALPNGFLWWGGEPSCFCQSYNKRRRAEVAAEQEMTDSWPASRPCVPCRTHSGWQIGKATMGQAPSAPRAAVMCPFSLHSPQPARPGLSAWFPERASPLAQLRVCLFRNPSHTHCICQEQWRWKFVLVVLLQKRVDS